LQSSGITGFAEHLKPWVRENARGVCGPRSADSGVRVTVYHQLTKAYDF
jgi:hypothetical protein